MSLQQTGSCIMPGMESGFLCQLDGLPVVPQPSVLNLHNLPPNLPQDLLPPFVCLHHIVALRGQVGALLLWFPCFLLFRSQQPAQ